MSAGQHTDIMPQHSQLATGREKLIGHLAMMLFAVLIAGSFSIGHLAIPHIGPAALNAVRFMLGSIFMGAAVLVILKRAPALPKNLWHLLILGILMATYFVLMFTALKITNPVATGAVFTLVPFMSALFGWLFLGQITRPTVFISLIIAAIGSTWMIFRGDINAVLNFDVGRGELIFFVGCGCHAAYAPLVKKFNTAMPVVEFTFWTLVSIAICLIIYGFDEIRNTAWLDLPAIVWWAVGYLSIFTTAITFFLVQFGSMRLHATKVLSYSYMTPGIIILIEGVVGHGWASLSVGVGALITVAGLIFLAVAPDG